MAAAWGAATAQRVEFGIRAGVPITESFDTGAFFTHSFGGSGESATRRFIGGPAAMVHFGRRLALEVDALYQRLGYDRTDKTGGVFYTFRSGRAASWEFPVMARVKLPARLYVSAGPSFRTVSGVSVGTARQNPIEGYGGGMSEDVFVAARSHFGGVAGVGVRLSFGRVKLSPEARYTRWREDAPYDDFLHSAQNQVAFLLGVTF